MAKVKKVHMFIDRDIASKLIQMKNVGDSYEDVISRLITFFEDMVFLNAKYKRLAELGGEEGARVREAKEREELVRKSGRNTPLHN